MNASDIECGEEREGYGHEEAENKGAEKEHDAGNAEYASHGGKCLHLVRVGIYIRPCLCQYHMI